MDLSSIANALNGKRTTQGYRCHCPAHDDKDPSLDVTEKDGKILFFCQAGCSQESVVSAIKAKGLWTEKKQIKEVSREKYIYDGVESTNALMVERINYDDGSKRIIQHHNNGLGWVRGAPEELVVPYKYRDWRNAPSVILVEGETCVHALVARGILATTTHGGASAWRSHAAQCFEGKDVIILPDNDSPGQKYASRAYADIAPVAKSVKIINLPGLRTKGDVVDWFKAGKTPDDLRKLILSDVKSDGPVDGDYAEFKAFFNRHLKGARKDIVSGRFLTRDGPQWQPVLAQIESIKSYANGIGLKVAQVPMHYARYENDQPGKLLIDYPEWDGVDRIDGLRNYVKFKNQDPDIFIDALKEWGANIFRRLYEEDAQNRCIILKGGQGIGKDHLLKSLFSGFGPYYAKFSSNRDERECWAQVTGRLVLHIEEFDQTGSLSIPFLKDLITRDWVTYRAPYAAAAVTRKCFGSFISSVNIDAVLRDETGNRRFAVFDIESIDWSYPKDWSAQILAQFYALYAAGYLAKESTWASVTTSNEQFEQVDVVPELLNMWDSRIGAISDDKGITEFEFHEIGFVLSDMTKVSGLKLRALCTMLKTNARAKRKHRGMVYWSNLKKGERSAPRERSRVRNIRGSYTAEDSESSD